MSFLFATVARVARPRLSHAVHSVTAPAASSCTAVRSLCSARSLRADAAATASAVPAASPSASTPALAADAPLDPNTSPVGLTGGAPEEFVRRTCRIYKPSRSATQQGPEYRWKIEFDTPNKWVNPLMGWTSARDTAQQLREMLYFKSEQDAIRYAEREGFHFTVLPYHAKQLKPKAFADNFKWKGQPKVVQQK